MSEYEGDGWYRIGEGLDSHRAKACEDGLIQIEHTWGGDFCVLSRAEIAELAGIFPTGRTTPADIRDCQHMWDATGHLWCYSEPADVWTVRETATPAGFVAPHSARSYQRLVAEFGPLQPYEEKGEQINEDC